MATKFKVIYRDNFVGIRKKNLEELLGKKISIEELMKICRMLEKNIPIYTKDLLTNAIKTRDFSELENFNVTNKTDKELYYNTGIRNIIIEIVQSNFDKVVIPKDIEKIFKPILYHYIIQELS